MRRQRPSVVDAWWAVAAATAVVLVLAAAACGGGSDEGKSDRSSRTTKFPPPASVKNENLTEGKGACGLLTRPEVEAAAGGAESGTGVKTETNESCRWSLRGGPNQFVAVITSTRGREAFDSARKQLSGAEQQSGLGDQAFAAGDSVYALKGDRLIIVEVVSRQPGPARKQAALKLAQLAVPRA